MAINSRERALKGMWVKARGRAGRMHSLRSWLLVVATLPLAATAQQIPPAVQAPQVTPRDLRPDLPLSPSAPLPEPAAQSVPPQAARLEVSPAEIVIEGGYPELGAATEALIAPLRGQRNTVARFYQLAEAVESIYRQADFPLVRVTLPPQSIVDGGTLRLLVLDGFIERVDASAVADRARARVLATMQTLVGRRRLSGATLERTLTLAGRGPGITMRSALGPGTATGAAVLVLEADHQPLAASLSADNKLSDALGPWSSTLQVRANQPFGQGEQFYGYFSGGTKLNELFTSDARRRVAGGGVIVPLGTDGLAFNLEYTQSNSQPQSPSLFFRTKSEFERYTARLSYPLVLSRQQELVLTVSADASRQVDSLPDFDFELSRDRLRVARFGADWTLRLPTDGRLGANAVISKGTNGLGARTQEDVAATGIGLSRFGADPSFLKLEASMVLDQPLGLGAQSRSVLRGQYANAVLPGSELFSLDGDDALSGFRTGALSDDKGWTLRQEFARPFSIAFGGAPSVLSPYLYAAAGKSGTRLAGAPVLGLGRSAGLGLRASWRAVSVAAEVGRATTLPFHTRETKAFLKAQVQF